MTSESLVRYANDWNCEAFGGRPEVSGRSERTATKLGGANGGGLASVAPTGEGCIGMHDNSVFLVPFYKPPFSLILVDRALCADRILQLRMHGKLVLF